MLHSFEINDLLLPATLILVSGGIFGFLITKSISISLATSLIKTLLFIWYFSVIFDGTFIFLDDIAYLEGAQKLLGEIKSLHNISDISDILLFSYSLAGGEHIFYYFYNSLALWLFGDGYYAPVALNLLFTNVIAYFGVKLASKEFEFTSFNRKIFYVFLFLNPDIISWATVINIKDILVLLMQLLFFWSISFYIRGDYRKSLALFSATFLALLTLRFYLPFLVLIISVTYLYIISTRVTLGRLLIFSVAMSLLYVYVTTGGGFDLVELFRESFTNPIVGVPRFLLTPTPLSVESDSLFLIPSAVFNWMCFPLLIFGIFQVALTSNRFGKWMLLHFLLLVLLYSMYGELQGPRHRIQLDYTIALLQFIGLSYLSRFISYTKSTPISSPNI